MRKKNEQPESDPQWPADVYTYREAAARLRCSYFTVVRNVARGKIKPCTYMVGLIPASEIERLLKGDK